MIFHELKEISNVIWQAHADINQQLEKLERDVRQKEPNRLTIPEKDEIIKMLEELATIFVIQKNQLDRIKGVEAEIDHLLQEHSG